MVNIHTFLQKQCCNDNCNKRVITDITQDLLVRLGVAVLNRNNNEPGKREALLLLYKFLPSCNYLMVN